MTGRPTSPPRTMTRSDTTKALRQGEQQPVQAFLQELTRRWPGDIEVWLLRASAADSRAEKLMCLSMALDLVPGHPVAQREMYRTLSAYLRQDAFLAYGSEDEHLYFVRTADGLPLAVPKQRAAPTPYPPPQPSPLQPAVRRLRWALLGLLPAGLGALVCAPLAAHTVLRARRLDLKPKERRRSSILLAAAFCLWAVALLWAVLLFLHL